MRDKLLIVGIVCLVLAQLSMTCDRFDMATDGNCTLSFSDLPKDSLYTVIACLGGGKCSRIEQLIKPVAPFVLREECIRIVYNDSVDMPFVMKNVWGSSIDSILVDQPTLIVFDFKLLTPCNSRYPCIRSDESEFIKNPIVRLIEKQEKNTNEIVSVLFDLNQPNLVIMDERYEELYKHCCENGVYSGVYPWLYKNRPLMSDKVFLNSMNRLYSLNKYKAKEGRKK